MKPSIRRLLCVSLLGAAASLFATATWSGSSAFAQPPGDPPPADELPPSGTVLPPSGTVNATVEGTLDRNTPRDPNTAAPAGTVPWAGAANAPALPSFLDTTDTRIVDERPPPSAEQVTALREMEAEVARFTNTGISYRDTVVSLVRREYLRQRRGRDQWYARQIREEERLLNEARERAIRLFERFVRRYPDDERYSPDAMFRLGELYFERSVTQYQEAYDAAQESGDDENLPDTPDLNPTVELYQRIVRNFPDYRRIDGVYYLIGYCLNEMARIDEARMAWLNLTCANHFTYNPDAAAEAEAAAAAEAAAEAEAAEAAEVEGADEHPSLTLDGEAEADVAPDVYQDPYLDCQPVMADARFLSETWFRIGEYHFDDYGDPHALDLSISAYNRILVNPEDRNYNLALYKVAWAYYRASRYPEAIQHFGMLVQWSDDQQRTTGRAGSELRPEAIQYLGISFAYDDWNENQIPDPQEGQPEGIARIQDGSLLPQDRNWTADVYFQLGQVYFDEAKFPEAIRVWRLALDRWPTHRLAPEYTNLIARAHQRHNEFEAAIEARSDLGNFREGTAWWNENVDNPAEQREAERLAENALIATAIHHHTGAQRMRRRCIEDQNVDLCRNAQAEYGLAAHAYRNYLRTYPNNPQAYELQYNLADALYWSEDYEQAAVEYGAVRDSNLDDSHLSEAARRVVEALKRVVDAAVENGSLVIRDEPPPPQGTPAAVRPVAMPELVQRLAQARELYVARVPERNDSEGVRAAYQYNNALLLYWYGYWTQARERLQAIFDERCSGPNANETGRVAWHSLRQMAVILEQTEEIRRLADVFTERACTFSASGEARDIDCSDPANEEEPQCVVAGDLNALQYRDAIAIYNQAEAGSGDEQVRLYERSATMLVEAVGRNPNDPQAPVALEWAATALERTARFESAAGLYQRIIDEVGPQRADDPERQAQLDAILANAYFRLAYNANRFFEFDRAVENYQTLADSRRFAASNDPAIVEKRVDGLVNAAIIMERLGRYREATQYYRRVYDTVDDAALKRRALYRIAEMAFRQENWNLAVRGMREFISRYQRDSDAGELVVQAYWRIAEARKEAGQARDYRSALQDVVNAFARSGQPAGSLAAEYAAQARFQIVDEGMAEFEDFGIQPGRPATLQAYVTVVARDIDQGALQAKALADGYGPITAYRRPTWTIASLVRQGRIWEILSRAVLNTPFVMPADMQRQFRRLPQDAREDIRIQVEDRIRMVLDEKVRPLECRAVAAYALAARASRAASSDDEYTQAAIDRLQAYGDERIGECIAEVQREDANFGAYTPGEFARAPRGLVLEIQPDITAPAIEAE